MEIYKINLPALRNEEHLQFMTDTNALIQSANLQPLNVDPLISTFTELLTKENNAVEVIRKSTLTDPVTDADIHRDEIYRGFVLSIESFSYSSQTDKAQAAHNIQVIIDHYGDFRIKPYNEETATINSFLQDINSRCSNDVSILNAGEWISDLSSANQAFDSLMNQRYDQNVGKEVIDLRETRKAIDSTYTQLISRINAYTLLNGNSEYGEFTEKLNNRISYFKNTLVQRKGRAAARKENVAAE